MVPESGDDLRRRSGKGSSYVVAAGCTSLDDDLGSSS